MATARLIVCEKTGKWAVALRRQMTSPEVRIFETRSLELCWADTAEARQSLVAVEVTGANLPTVIPWLRRFRHAYPHACCVALLQRGLQPAEWLLREAGAVHVVGSPRDLQPLLRLARRHLQRTESESANWEPWLWEQLPWSDAADMAPEV